jgi:hypothetical protein
MPGGFIYCGLFGAFSFGFGGGGGGGGGRNGNDLAVPGFLRITIGGGAGLALIIS